VQFPLVRLTEQPSPLRSRLSTLKTVVSQTGLLPNATGGGTATGVLGGPYVQSWPSNSPHYAFAILGGQLLVEAPYTATVAWVPTAAGTTLATGLPYTGPSVCSGVV
jgi:hypothetical protein